jgi:hypothetical protein
VLELAREDPAVVGAAVTGWLAVGGGDEWSEVNIAFTPAADFGLRGPNWQTVFAETGTAFLQQAQRPT